MLGPYQPSGRVRPAAQPPTTGRTMWDAFAETAGGRPYVMIMLVAARYWPRGVVGVVALGVGGLVLKLLAHWH